MANTLKFGNGEWAIKEGSALAYNDENGNFKPLPFDFTRASTATYVAKDGLIKTAAIGEPRIDFLNNSDGALKLEPQRTNNIQQSEDYSNAYWAKSVSISSDATTSPDGLTNADKLIESSTNTQQWAYRLNLAITSGLSYTISIFAKKEEVRYLQMRLLTNINLNAIFDLDLGTITRTVGGIASIEDYGNGWYKCSVSGTATSTGNAEHYLNLNTNGYTSGQSYLGDGTSGIYVWGSQLEQGSYPTSYIPTQGSTVTRVGESSLQGGFQDKNIFGSTQGSVVLEFKWDIGAYVFDLSDASGIRLRIFDGGSDWKIRDYTGASWVNTGFAKSNNVKTKIAFKWNGTELTTFQDGVKSSSTDSFASSMSIESITTNKLNNTSNMQFYNTALTDQELINLTTL